MIFSFLAGSLWGSVPVVTKIALREFSPFEISFSRALIAYLFLSLVFVLTKRGASLLPWRGSILYVAAVAFFGIAFFWTLLNLGLLYTETMHSVFLITVYPVLIPIIAPYFIGEKTTLREFLGAFSALCGAYVLISGGSWMSIYTSPTMKGDIISFSASLSFACYVLMQRKWGKKFTPEYVTVNMMGFGLIFLFLMCLVFWQPVHHAHVPIKLWLALLWLAIGCSAIPLLLLNTSLKSSRATFSAVPLLIAPLVGFVLSVLVLGERITLSSSLGGLMILSGICLVVFRGKGRLET